MTTVTVATPAITAGKDAAAGLPCAPPAGNTRAALWLCHPGPVLPASSESKGPSSTRCESRAEGVHIALGTHGHGQTQNERQGLLPAFLLSAAWASGVDTCPRERAACHFQSCSRVPSEGVCLPYPTPAAAASSKLLGVPFQPRQGQVLTWPSELHGTTWLCWASQVSLDTRDTVGSQKQLSLGSHQRVALRS